MHKLALVPYQELDVHCIKSLSLLDTQIFCLSVAEQPLIVMNAARINNFCSHSKLTLVPETTL
jgi:hypothetical protein